MIPEGKLGMVPLEKFFIQGPDASHFQVGDYTFVYYCNADQDSCIIIGD